jgi:hypothetical protein
VHACCETLSNCEEPLQIARSIRTGAERTFFVSTNVLVDAVIEDEHGISRCSAHGLGIQVCWARSWLEFPLALAHLEDVLDENFAKPLSKAALTYNGFNTRHQFQDMLLHAQLRRY